MTASGVGLMQGLRFVARQALNRRARSLSPELPAHIPADRTMPYGALARGLFWHTVQWATPADRNDDLTPPAVTVTNVLAGSDTGHAVVTPEGLVVHCAMTSDAEDPPAVAAGLQTELRQIPLFVTEGPVADQGLKKMSNVMKLVSQRQEHDWDLAELVRIYNSEFSANISVEELSQVADRLVRDLRLSDLGDGKYKYYNQKQELESCRDSLRASLRTESDSALILTEIGGKLGQAFGGVEIYLFREREKQSQGEQETIPESKLVFSVYQGTAGVTEGTEWIKMSKGGSFGVLLAGEPDFLYFANVQQSSAKKGITASAKKQYKKDFVEPRELIVATMPGVEDKPIGFIKIHNWRRVDDSRLVGGPLYSANNQAAKVSKSQVDEEIQLLIAEVAELFIKLMSRDGDGATIDGTWSRIEGDYLRFRQPA
ncbi:MAG: hypothetical protein ABH823_04870 [bacterium]